MEKVKNNIINLGEDFKKVSNKKIDIFNKRFLTINQCYERPSYSKINIYNYYYDLLLKNCDSVLYYGVKSYNTFKISLNAIIKKDNIKYYVLITPAHNYILEIKED